MFETGGRKHVSGMKQGCYLYDFSCSLRLQIGWLSVIWRVDGKPKARNLNFSVSKYLYYVYIYYPPEPHVLNWKGRRTV